MLFELGNKMYKRIRYIQLVRCERLSCGACETAQSQIPKQAKNHGGAEIKTEPVV